jgi:hypothetical protein
MIPSLIAALCFFCLAISAGFCQAKIDPGQINWSAAAGCGSAGAAFNPATNSCVVPFRGDIDATGQPGGDLGAQINAAYSSCADGCRITVPPGHYSMSTPVVIATKGKNAIVECSGTSTTLTWTPSTGTMFQFAGNGGGTGNGWGSGIRFCNLASPSSTAVAVQFGMSASDKSGRSAQGAYLDNVQITGFGIQYDLESQAWNISVHHSEFLNPARYAIYANPSAVNSGENLSFVDITVADSFNKWIPHAVDLNLGSVIATFTSSNFDNAEVFCGAGTMNLISPYSENPGSVLRTTPWIDIGKGCVSTIVGMTAADDDTGVPATQVALSVEGSLSFYGGTIFGQNPATATFETRGAGHVFLGGDLDLPAAVPVLVNSSGQSFVSLTRSAPVIGSRALQLRNPVPAANHWYGLENTLSGERDDVFVQQDGSNSDLFSICLQSAAIFFCPLQAEKTGHFLGLHGAPDGVNNQHLYGTSRIDSLSINGGAAISTANSIPTVGTPAVGHAACVKSAGPPVALGYCSSVVASDGSCVCN